MSTESLKSDEWFYISLPTREQALREFTAVQSRLQPGQKARIYEAGPEDFQILITDN